MHERKAPPPAACPATARGIAQCLRMLAEEAATLNLTCTVRALWAAVAICERESCPAPTLPAAEPAPSTVASLN
jgi:hypothetical protein